MMTKIGVLIRVCQIVGAFESKCLKIWAHYEKSCVSNPKGRIKTSVNSSLPLLLNYSDMIVVTKVPRYLQELIGIGDQV